MSTHPTTSNISNERSVFDVLVGLAEFKAGGINLQQIASLINDHIKQECDRARIDELERFEWNDPHMYVHTRLATLLKGEKDA